MFLAFLRVRMLYLTRHSAYAIVQFLFLKPYFQGILLYFRLLLKKTLPPLLLPLLFLSLRQCKSVVDDFVLTGSPCDRGVFLYFWTMDMDLWVEFWKFVSKCFQVFTWPYVYISMKFQKGMYSNST